MTKELVVNLETQIGLFKGNFKEIKQDLTMMVSQYDGLVYSEDNEKMAREDAAQLRKLRKAIDEKRISTKKEYMKPAELFDEQCKELLGVVDLTIEPIAKQCDEFDKKRRGIKKEAIFKYFQDNITGLEEYAMFTDVFTDQMLNVNYSIKQYKLDINNYVTKIQTDVKTLEDTESEFAWKALEDYKKNKDLAAAFKTITLLEEQKRAILEKERREREEIERKKEEERRIQAEAERRARERIEQERIEAERARVREEERKKAEAERLVREEAERVERERILAEQKAEFERLEAERKERERLEREEIEKERKRLEAERVEREIIEAEQRLKREEEMRKENERLQAEIAKEKARIKAERIQREQQIARAAEEERVKLEAERKEQEENDQIINEMLGVDTTRYRMIVLGMTKSQSIHLTGIVKSLGHKFRGEVDV